MGLKGLKAIKTLNPNYIGLISKVVVGTDKAIKEDYSKDIQTVAKNLGVEYGFNKYEKLDDSETGIAIAWRWIINCEKIYLLSMIVFFLNIEVLLRCKVL